MPVEGEAEYAKPLSGMKPLKRVPTRPVRPSRCGRAFGTTSSKMWRIWGGT